MDPLSGKTATPATQAAAAPKDTTQPDGSAVLSSDFETFLVMLTAQLQNQDPLNPMDSSDYAVQLATFSSVEQQVRTNDLLTQMIDGSSLSGLADLAGWVGMEARSAAPVDFTGAPVALYFEPQPGAVRGELVVRDASGEEVQRLDVSDERAPLAWTGVDSMGQPLPEGAYAIEHVSYNADSVSQTLPVESYATVSEVRHGPDGAEIVLQAGTVLPASQVTAIRQPGAI